MTAELIDGARIAREVRAGVGEDVARFTAETGRTPGLATILVGEDPASEVYVRNKRRLAVEAGMTDQHRHLHAGSSSDDIAHVIRSLAADDAVSGILLQLPLPGGLASGSLIDLIPAEKDVDGLTTASAGRLARGVEGFRPCTPSGVMTLIDSTGIDLSGAEAVVVGRSELVGGPAARLLLDRDATVTMAHSRTRDLAAVASRADVLVVAAGRVGLIGAEHVKPGALVIDVGIARTADGLVGDVRFDEVREVAGWLTPVPGGVGPMTIAMLLKNTLDAAVLQHSATGALSGGAGRG